MSAILNVNHLTIQFGGLTAVDDVTLSQESGEILSLIGPNGAGKTTLFNLLTGVYQPTYGNIVFHGENISKLKAYERARKGIARTFQNIRLFQSMTVLENLLVAHPECNMESIPAAFNFGKKLRDRRNEIVKECEGILDIVGLREEEGELAVNLPYGKQRLLEIGRALATGPSLILLDEPGAGMNSFEKEELTRVIRHIIDRLKIDVLLIEHDMRFVMNISDRIIVLDRGKIIAEGKPEEIQTNRRVVEAYLGTGNIDIE